MTNEEKLNLLEQAKTYYWHKNFLEIQEIIATSVVEISRDQEHQMYQTMQANQAKIQKQIDKLKAEMFSESSAT